MAWKWWFGVVRSPIPLLPQTFLNIHYYLCKSPAQVTYRSSSLLQTLQDAGPSQKSEQHLTQGQKTLFNVSALPIAFHFSLCEILSPPRAPTASLGFDSPYLSLYSWMKASLGRRCCPDQKQAEFLSSDFYPSPKKTGIFGSIKTSQIYVGFVTSAEKIKVISPQVLTHFQTEINKLISINKKILKAL